MEDFTFLDEICRLCLINNTKESFKIFLDITESHQTKFQDVTQTDLPLSQGYPLRICSECSDHLENFHFYKNQLIRKQNELLQFLKLAEKNILTAQQNQQNLEHGETDEDEYSEYVALEEAMTEDEENVIEAIDEFEEVEEMLASETDDQITQEYDHLDSEDQNVIVITSNDKPKKIKKIVPRLDEVKFEKKDPTLVLSPDFLKAREALRKLPAKEHKKSHNARYILVSNSDEQFIFICSDSSCNAQFQSEQEMELHIADHKFVSGVRTCEFCPLKFKTKHNYEKHVESVHNDVSFICQICGKIMESKAQWRGHIRNHDKTQKFKCTVDGCEKAFRVKHHLDNHLRVHSQDSPFKCNFENCTASFRQKHALTVHIRKHTGQFVHCEICKSPFVTAFNLKKHLTNCDGIYKPLRTRNDAKDQNYVFKCLHCDESFKTKAPLEKHLLKAHELTVTPTMCVICCQKYDSLQDLKAHMREHLPFQCFLCGINFKNEESFSKHKHRENEEFRPNKCSECPAAFKRAEHLRTHVAFKHSNVRPFACDLCSYVSTRRNDLNAHMKTHIKDKDLACRYCDYTAKCLGTIKIHMKTSHNTDDYYFCNSCSISFKYQVDLFQHQKDGC